jgi:hypothetical protein
MEGEAAPVFQDTLADDGRNGDIIPRDGVYHGFLTPASVEGKTGSYRVGVAAEDRGRHLSDTLFAAFSAVDGVMNQPPVLSDPIVPDMLVLDSLKNVFFSIRAGDPQGLETIDSVNFQIFPPLSPVPTFQGSLRDDGTAGDLTAGDGIFSSRQDMSDVLKIQGTYSLRFEATDREGLKSSPVVVQIRVVRENAPPVLSNISAPDSVSRLSTPPFLISIRATDPQGLEDVKRVYFNTTKPDGSPSTGNPIYLFDDGTQGDRIAGDGIFSRTVQIGPENDKGIYRFDFFAEDQSGTVSQPLTHNITVMDQLTD